MTTLDIRTVILFYLFSDAVCGAFLIFLWRQCRERYQGTGFWAANYLLRLGGLILILARGVVPDFLSMVVANTLVLAGAWALLVGLERFLDKRGPQAHNGVLLAAFVLVHGYFTLAKPDLSVRNINISIGIIVLSVQTAWLLLRRCALPHKASVRGLAGIMIAFSLLGVSRIVHMLMGVRVEDFFRSGSAESLLLIVMGALNIALVLGLHLLVNERLEVDRQADEARRMRAEEVLRASESKYRALVETTGTGYLILDPEGRVLDANAEYVRLTGRGGLQEILGRCVTEWTAKPLMETNKRAVEKCMKEGALRGLVIEYDDGKGTHTPVEIDATVVGEGERRSIISLCRDISERKRAEAETRRKESFTKTLLETIPVPVFYKDRQGRYQGFNRAYEEFFSAKREALIGKTVFEIAPTELAGQYHAKDEELFRSGGRQVYDSQVRSATGDLREVVFNKAALKDEAGDVVGLVGAVLDITERKKMAAAVLESEIRYRTLFDQAADGIVIMPADGGTLTVNRSFARMHGYAGPEEMSHLRLSDLDAPTSAERSSERLKRLLAGEAMTFEVEHYHKDGHVFPLSVSCNVAQIGGVTCFLGFHRDTTQLKKAEEALRRQDALFRHFFEGLTIGVAVWDVRPEGVVCLADINPAGARISRVIREAVVGKPAEEAFPGVSSFGLLDVIRRVHRTGSPEDYPAKLYEDDRGAVWFENRVFRLPSGQVAAVYEDVTERKRMEEDLLRMQKIESLGLLAGGIAHDFNNMLTGVLGSLSLLKEHVEGEPAELATEAEGACQAAKGLARQLLTFSSGGEPLVEDQDVAPILKSAAGFAARGVGVRCHFDIQDAPLIARVDKDQLSQVVQNLVMNAVQAMPTGGEVWVRAGRADGADGRWVRIAVEDQGVGIPKEILSRVFDPYFSTKGKGRGLGLAVCHSIVNKHGGRIAVESTPGKGTRFDLRLPASEAAADKRGSEGVKEQAGARVLIMDDDAAVAKVLERMLKRLGCATLAVRDGQAALEAYRSARESGKSFDVVVLDMTVVGGMGGKEAAGRLKAMDPHIRIIATSGYSQDSELSDPRAHGFCGVLAKPYTLEDLSRVLAGALGEKRG